VRQGSHLDGLALDHRILDRRRPVTDDDVSDGDVVIATWWETAEWVNTLSASKGAKVYFIQGHEIFPHLPVVRSQATYQLPFHKIVVAPWLKRIMNVEYGDNVVDIVPNSVDTEQFFASARGKQQFPTVGFVYATLPSKGLDVVLAALRSVRQNMPQLRIISFGGERPRSDLPLPEGTRFILLPAQDQLRELYALCDVWVAAGRTEGFGLPAMEAMACRTPVVSTQTVKSGWNGVLVRKDDVEGFAAGVGWVLSRSDQEWRELSSNALATILAGSWEQSAKLFEAALVRACDRARRGEIAGSPGTFRAHSSGSAGNVR
jgi:glycosyltransferase involved in cell wall biosynthesis